MSKKDKHVEVILSSVANRWESTRQQVRNCVAEYEVIAENVDSNIAADTLHKDGKLETKVKSLSQALEQLRKATEQPNITIAVTGTTSSGKSTIANLLIGAALLPKGVQEMSAGVVHIQHDDTAQALTIEPTEGASWETGAWSSVSADEIRTRLHDAMQMYLKHTQEAGTQRVDMQPPRAVIKWPTRVGQDPRKFGIPIGSDISIVDLPGLKYANDTEMRDLIGKQARKAFCLVAYNSEETGRKKQTALLDEVVDQVKSLGGSPRRMLFILNRIDVFRRDEEADVSEQAFITDMQDRIRTQVAEALPEHAEASNKITPIPLSSEPALYSYLAEHGNGNGNEILSKIDRNYGLLFDDGLNELPRRVDDWEPSQRRWFIQETKEESKAHEFRRRLQDHISTNLPEIVIPELVDSVYKASIAVHSHLDAKAQAYKKETVEEVEYALQALEETHAALRDLKKKSLSHLDPLLRVAELEKGQMAERLGGSVSKVEKKLNLNREENGALSALPSALADAVQVPLQKLAEYVFKLAQGESPSDSFIRSTHHTAALQQAVEHLRNSPYSGEAMQNGKQFKSHQVQAVRRALKQFARVMSKAATHVIKQESRTQADRMKEALQVCANAVARQVREEAAAKFDNVDAEFPRISNVFTSTFTPRSPDLPSVQFEPDISKWRYTKQKEVTKEREVKKRTWKTLWLIKTTEIETYTAYEDESKEGIKVASLDELIQGFMRSGDVHKIESAYAEWIQTTIDKFGDSLDDRLEKGMNLYRSALGERREVLEENKDESIKRADRFTKVLNDTHRQIEDSKDWRTYT